MQWFLCKCPGRDHHFLVVFAFRLSPQQHTQDILVSAIFNSQSETLKWMAVYLYLKQNHSIWHPNIEKGDRRAVTEILLRGSKQHLRKNKNRERNYETLSLDVMGAQEAFSYVHDPGTWGWERPETMAASGLGTGPFANRSHGLRGLSLPGHGT